MKSKYHKAMETPQSGRIPAGGSLVVSSAIYLFFYFFRHVVEILSRARESPRSSSCPCTRKTLFYTFHGDSCKHEGSLLTARQWFCHHAAVPRSVPASLCLWEADSQRFVNVKKKKNIKVKQSVSTFFTHVCLINACHVCVCVSVCA